MGSFSKEVEIYLECNNLYAKLNDKIRLICSNCEQIVGRISYSCYEYINNCGKRRKVICNTLNNNIVIIDKEFSEIEEY